MATLTKEKGEKTPVNKMRNEREEVTTDKNKIQRIIKKYSKRLRPPNSMTRKK